MRKTEQILKARREHIKVRVNSSKCVDVEVKKLAVELFLSERTIMNDLKK
jgi:DeoR/GlpR family transcriptional regulator of sugar metabolism